MNTTYNKIRLPNLFRPQFLFRIFKALDPPRSNLIVSNARTLRKDDAQFIQVLHTTRMIGSTKAMGHQDFFANAGTLQPGCDDSLCSHSRANQLFAASIDPAIRLWDVNRVDYFGFHSQRIRGEFQFKTSATYPYTLE